VQCAHAAARTKGSYFQALRRGVNKAIVAVTASILTTIYHMLKDGTMYVSSGITSANGTSKEARA
jgi:transposase